jgi:hypothetical protein
MFAYYLLAAVFVSVAALPVLADDESVVTGCLQNGRLTELAIGNTPAKPCKRKAEEVTFPLAGQQPSPNFQTPFFVTMNVGDDDIVVGENGPLEAVARCFPSPASGLDRSRLLLRSSVDGWSLTQAVDPTRFNLFDLPAGEQAIGGITNSGPEIGGAFGASAIAPDGSVLTVAGDTTLVGMHVFADFDCVMSGVVTTISQAGGG